MEQLKNVVDQRNHADKRFHEFMQPLLEILQRQYGSIDTIDNVQCAITVMKVEVGTFGGIEEFYFSSGVLNGDEWNPELVKENLEEDFETKDGIDRQEALMLEWKKESKVM